MNGFFKMLLDSKGIMTVEGRGEGDITLFVRNPIERLISIYYHFNVIRGVKESYKTKIRGLEKFLESYEEVCEESNDPHLLPQSQNIEWRGDEKIIKMEDLRKGYNDLIVGYKPSSNIDYSTSDPFFTAEEYKRNFGFVEDLGIPMDNRDRMYSIALYSFIHSGLSIGHHHNQSGHMLNWLVEDKEWDILKRLKDITKDEMELFGYNDNKLI